MVGVMFGLYIIATWFVVINGYVVAQNVTENTLFLRKTKEYNYLSYIHSLVFSLRGRAGRNQSPVM